MIIGRSLKESYLSVEMQSVYSATSTDWARDFEIQTDQPMQVLKPELMSVDKKKRTLPFHWSMGAG